MTYNELQDSEKTNQWVVGKLLMVVNSSSHLRTSRGMDRGSGTDV